MSTTNFISGFFQKAQEVISWSHAHQNSAGDKKSPVQLNVPDYSLHKRSFPEKLTSDHQHADLIYLHNMWSLMLNVECMNVTVRQETYKNTQIKKKKYMMKV